MIREVIKPTNNTYVLNLPDEMVGKTVEVIAFEINNKTDLSAKTGHSHTIQEIKDRYSKYPTISHDNYKFDRDEANN